MAKKDKTEDAGNESPEQNLYLLRHKQGNRGIQLNMVKARSKAVAEHVGQAYCNRNMGYTYIRIEDAVVADESILDPRRLKEFLQRLADQAAKEQAARDKEAAGEQRQHKPLKSNPNATSTGNNNLDDLDDDEETEEPEEAEEPEESEDLQADEEQDHEEQEEPEPEPEEKPSKSRNRKKR